MKRWKRSVALMKRYKWVTIPIVIFIALFAFMVITGLQASASFLVAASFTGFLVLGIEIPIWMLIDHIKFYNK